jgi:hypothetical protein
MAICPSTLDSWLDWNAGEVSVFITIEELSSDAKNRLYGTHTAEEK